MTDIEDLELATRLECERRIEAILDWLDSHETNGDWTPEMWQERKDKIRNLLMWRGRLSLLCRGALN